MTGCTGGCNLVLRIFYELLYNRELQSRFFWAREIGQKMMSYALVVALVLGALLVAPTIAAVRTLLQAATTSPMVTHVSEGKRTFVLVLVGVVGFYAEYIGWAATHTLEWDTDTAVLVIFIVSGLASITIALEVLAWQLMCAHRAFDSDGQCSERALRTMLRQYFAASDSAQKVMFHNRFDGVRLGWEDRSRELKPAIGTSNERLLAVAHATFPPDLTVVEIVRKQTGDAVPRAQYKNELDPAT